MMDGMKQLIDEYATEAVKLRNEVATLQHIVTMALMQYGSEKQNGDLTLTLSNKANNFTSIRFHIQDDTIAIEGNRNE